MVDVFYCVDNGARGRQWLRHSIDSLVKNCSGEYRVFVASQTPFKHAGSIWIDAVPYIERFKMARIQDVVTKIGTHPSPMQIFRLAAPCLNEFADMDTLLYLDIDTEIVRPGLNALPRGGFGADVMALYENGVMCRDSVAAMLSDGELRAAMSPSTVDRLSNGGYFNSGVMLMDLAWMRRNHPEWGNELPHIVDMAVRHHRVMVDQDISNVVLTAVPLPSEFNVMPDTDVRYNTKDPCVIHYANMSKYKTSVYPPPKVRAKLLKSLKK